MSSIIRRPRVTKYHARNYGYEIALVLALLSAFGAGVVVGLLFGGNW